MHFVISSSYNFRFTFFCVFFVFYKG